MAVVLYHCRHYANALGKNPDTIFRFFTDPWSYGAWFFFTLSGFLMAQLIDTGCPWFLPRRLLRIYPTYLVAVMCALFISALAFGTVQMPYLARAVTLMPLGRSVNGQPIGYPLGVEWTLIFEVFFYLVCALFAWGPMRRAFLPFLAAWAGVILYCGLAIGQKAWLSSNESWNLPILRSIGLSQMNLLFIAGALAYHALKWWRHPGPWGVSALVLAGASMLAAFAFQLLPGPLGLFSLGGAFAAVVMLACMWERARKKEFRMPLLERWGDYSYGLYLMHVPLLTVSIVLFMRAGGKPVGNLMMLAAFAAAMIGGGVFGAIDLRIHSYWRRWFSTLTNRASSARAQQPATVTTSGR